MAIAHLDIDLDIFTGPFDLLLALILREEVDLLELQLTEVIIAYIDHLESKGELDLEAATEFLVLITSLLELKSRMMLPQEEIGELLEMEPVEAAEELLKRMLDHQRYKGASEFLGEQYSSNVGYLYRSAPLPKEFRDIPLQQAESVYAPARLGRAVGTMLKVPERINLKHMAMPRVTVAERLDRLRSLLKRGRVNFDDAVKGADRVTVAVTIWALLELYRRGEADWEQEDAFGAITIQPLDAPEPVVQAPSFAA